MHVFTFQLDLDDFKTVCPDDLNAALGFQIYKDLRNGKSYKIEMG